MLKEWKMSLVFKAPKNKALAPRTPTLCSNPSLIDAPSDGAHGLTWRSLNLCPLPVLLLSPPFSPPPPSIHSQKCSAPQLYGFTAHILIKRV